MKLIRNTFIAIAIITSSITSHALEFMGENINKMNAEQLDKFLISKGAKRVSNNGITAIYDLSKSSIPHSFGARTFVNQKKEFVGLEILFEYDPNAAQNLRRALSEKYNLGSNFAGQHFFDKKTWKVGKDTSIEFNSHSSDQKKDSTLKKYSSHFLFYRNDVRRNALLKDLKEQSYKQEKDKLKSVF